MAIRPIVIHGDPALHAPTEPVTESPEELAELVQDMYETMDAANGVGLAANQIGVSLRAFSWHLVETGAVGYILNPVIVELSEDLQHDDEGCLSVPWLFYPRTRSAYARCVGTNLEGAEIAFAGEGIVARLIQHEVGHLAGELYIAGLERSVKKRAWRQIREPL